MNHQNEGSRKLLAALGLVITTMIWGSAFVVMKNSVDLIPPTYLVAIRFSLAAVLLGLLFGSHLKTASRRTLRCGFVLGFILWMAYLFQTYGLKHTTASKNAFITTLYVILVPFLSWVMDRKRPGLKNIGAALIAVIGLALLSLQGDLGINYGDFLTLVCGFMFAFQVIFTDRYTQKEDPIVLTVLQIGFVAILSWISAPLLDGSFELEILFRPSLLFGLFYLAAFSTTICFLLQNVGQKYLSASTAAILLSLESVFGAVFSVIFLKDRLTGRMLIGCILMFAAILISEMPQAGGKGKTEAGK